MSNILTHQELGNKLELFFVDDSSPGSIFWKPRGALLFNNLIKLMRDLYNLHDFVEVVTPNMYDKKLWETSGHWDKYRENMFLVERTNHKHESADNEQVDKIDHSHQFALKPMNCVGHCLIFKNMKPYLRDLPIRMAEFGVLHRNEASGALHGLTRVRRFQQDDAHIFCSLDQVEKEVLTNLTMIKKVYELFDLKSTIKLSTRPTEYIGTVELWDKAEQILENSIKAFSKSKVKKNVGDGAFYGPKIDVTLIDKYGRSVQCGTIQLDFNLPERFDLSFVDEHTQIKDRPVIVHRAVLGSIERFIGIILESGQGRLPIQVSPYPVIIVTVHKEFNEPAHKLKNYIQQRLRLRIDIDDSTEDIKNKIKSAERKFYCYILTVGKNEAESISNSLEFSHVAVRKNKVVSDYYVINLINEIESFRI